MSENIQNECPEYVDRETLKKLNELIEYFYKEIK